MARPSPYPAELRRRAVRMVAEVRPDYDTEWAAMKAVAAKLGIGTTETLRKWVRQAEVDTGRRPGTTSEESADAGSQYTSIAYTERLAQAGIDPSVGTVGDAYDNALAESVIGLFKTELIKPRGPWRTVEQVEIATLEYVDWFNHHRLYESCGDIPSAELETAHYRQQAALAEAGHSSP